MNSFHSARLKLTIWYVAFVMLLSFAFSLGAYRFLMLELERGLSAQTTRIFGRYAIQGQIVSASDIADIYNEARHRIIYSLVILNGGIFLLAAATSYILAGKTLKPLELAVEEQKRFIADASHELKTPLTALRTEIEVAIRDKVLTIKEAKKLLKSNLEEVDKIKQLTSYLLSLGKYENAKNDEGFSSLPIKNILVNAIKQIKVSAKEKNIQMEETISDFEVYANAESLKNMLVILLDNAIKYSSSGKHIFIRSYRVRNKKVIEIKDEGIGIKSVDLPYIFNRFYRADTSRTKQKVDGYGLGLSIAESIADLHKAKIEVESELGRGSTFKVIFNK